MKSKSIMSKVIAGVMMAGLVMSMGTAVSAASTNHAFKNAPTAHMQSGNNGVKSRTNGMKTQLDALVTAGTITADQETAIETAMQSSKGDFKTALAALVTAGTITSAQETAIETALTPKDNGNGGKHEDGMKTQLDALVTAGTITADQETAIEAALTPSK